MVDFIYICLFDVDESTMDEHRDQQMEFIDGVHSFFSVANADKPKGFICCPCKKCKKQKQYSTSRTLHVHLLQSRFIPTYNCWTLHGALEIAMQEDGEEDDNIPDWT